MDMNFLELVEHLMDEYEMSEEDACRIAFLELNEAEYDADDYA